jgi:hypothetical protein
MTFRSLFSSALAVLTLPAACAAQQATGVLSVEPPQRLVVKRNEPAVQKLKINIQPGYHANSNKPSESYLIPFKLTWEPGPLEATEIVYPPAKMEKFSFSESPLSIYDGAFEVASKFKKTATAQPGPAVMTGKLRYQACNDKMCLPPKTVEVKLSLLIE